jgi:PAS domain S-box-containing protein
MNEQDPAPDPAYLEALAVLEHLSRGEAAARSGPSPKQPDSEQPIDGFPRPTAAADAPCSPPAWSEAVLRSLLEALPDALVVIDPAGLIVLVNEKTENLFGYQRKDLLGRPLEILVPERFRGAHVEHRKTYFASPRSRAMGSGAELLGRRKDGSTFPVEISLSPLQTDNNLLAMSIIRDISQRKREEAKYRTLVENIPAVTFVAPLDESAPELYVSPQIEKLLGFSQEEWLADPVLWYRQLHPEDRHRWNEQFAPTCSEGEPFQSVYRFLSKDGRVVWVHGSASVVRDGNGGLLFLQGIAFDITSIKEAEQELLELNAELERRVKERTATLAQSLADLREKTEELEEFAYVASHDLREPLRSLVNYPQKLAERYSGKLDPQAEDQLRRTINGADRMRRLIDDLTKYSRVLRRDQAQVLIDCRSVMEEARANLQAAVEESGATVSLGDLPTVLGNPQQLLLLFQNLVGNAIKFRDAARPIQVEVGARAEEDGWLFWVRDNGIGIEARHLRRIFGLGQRLHPASRYPGTGFGLAICEKIVTRQRGRIWVESQPAEGSTFFFTWPANSSRGPEGNGARQADLTQSRPPGPATGL